MSRLNTVVFCDGASKGNPGPGGWGVVVATTDGHVTELGGSAAHTTNNKMELTAAIEALTHARGIDGPVAIYTDSTASTKVSVGEIFAGPGHKTQSVPALAAGTYFFRCDVHPDMHGTLVAGTAAG